jgi:hypothetical protein
VGNWYRGSLDGVPVVHNRILQRDRIIVVGARWGKYEEWVPSPDDPLDLELEEMATPQKNFRLTVTRWGMLTVEDPQVAAAFRIDDLQLRPEFGESDR